MERKQERLNVAVVGIGPAAKIHAREYAATPGVTIVAVVDPNVLMRRRFAAEHPVLRDVSFITLLVRLTAKQRVDALDLCEYTRFDGDRLLEQFPEPMRLLVSTEEAVAVMNGPLQRASRPFVHVVGVAAHWAHEPAVQELAEALRDARLRDADPVLRLGIVGDRAGARKELLSPLLDLLADVTGSSLPAAVARITPHGDSSMFGVQLTYRCADGRRFTAKVGIRTQQLGDVDPTVTWHWRLPGDSAQQQLTTDMSFGATQRREVRCFLTCTTGTDQCAARTRRVRARLVWQALEASASTGGAPVRLRAPGAEHRR